MRKFVLAVSLSALAALACGCKHPGAKLEGRWRGTRASGVTPAVQDAASAFATQTEIVARGRLISVTTPTSKAPPTNFIVDEETKTKLVLHADKDGAKETFTFADDGKTMSWRVGDNAAIVFAKQKD